jgi:hypothetical protein
MSYFVSARRTQQASARPLYSDHHSLVTIVKPVHAIKQEKWAMKQLQSIPVYRQTQPVFTETSIRLANMPPFDFSQPTSAQLFADHLLLVHKAGVCCGDIKPSHARFYHKLVVTFLRSCNFFLSSAYFLQPTSLD